MRPIFVPGFGQVVSRGHLKLESRYIRAVADDKRVSRREFMKLAGSGVLVASLTYAEKGRTRGGRGGVGGGVPSTGFYPSGHFITARQPMILNYPRPDSETATWARHHYAFYDGANAIEYDVPIIIGFGAFPFVAQIMPGTPSWLSIPWEYWPAWGSGNNWLPGLDAHTNGYLRIKGTPSGPVSGATVWVRIWDQQLNYIDVKWLLSTASTWTSTNGYGFLFADSATGSNSNSGSFSSRLADLTGLFGSTYATTTFPGAIAYLATGNSSTSPYEPPQYSDQDFGFANPCFEFSTVTKPGALLALPGDIPIIDATQYPHCLTSNDAASDLYLKDFTINGYPTTQTTFKPIYIGGKSSGAYRQTVDGVIYTNGGPGTGSASENDSAVFCPGGSSSFINYLSITGLSETNRAAGSGATNYPCFCIYNATNFVGQFCSSINTSVSVDGGCYQKSDVQNGCTQGCFISFSNSNYPFSFGQSVVTPENLMNSESRFNLGLNSQEIYAPAVSTAGTLWVYRNTTQSTTGNGVGLVAQGSSANLSWFGSNVVQSSYTPIPSGSSLNIQTDGHNLIGTALLNADGTLVSGQSANLGLVGVQIA